MADRRELFFLKKPYTFILGLFILIKFAKNETHSLYKKSDPMVQFSNGTIIDGLTDSDKVWIVEFYSSWCGHCQMFAPKWVRLSYELKSKKIFIVLSH